MTCIHKCHTHTHTCVNAHGQQQGCTGSIENLYKPRYHLVSVTTVMSTEIVLHYWLTNILYAAIVYMLHGHLKREPSLHCFGFNITDIKNIKYKLLKLHMIWSMEWEFYTKEKKSCCS